MKITELIILLEGNNDNSIKINKTLIKKFGLIKAGYLSNLFQVYRTHLWKNPKSTQFICTYKEQMELIGLSEHQLRICKNFFIQKGILSTEIKGAPAKEYYKINIDKIGNILLEGEK